MIDAVRENLDECGFAILNAIYTAEEIDTINNIISNAKPVNSSFRRSADLFAIRQFFKQVPELRPLIFNNRLKDLINRLFGDQYFVVKSIYFDKPEQSNWFVAYHQDLMISVDGKMELAGYGPWTFKENQYAVQPPVELLKRNFTLRIHLDDTDGQNGALRVIEGSHQKGIFRPETINFEQETERVCAVEAGGLMLMRPLLLHASSRSTNSRRRRVIHIEFSDSALPEGLDWAEKWDFLSEP